MNTYVIDLFKDLKKFFKTNKINSFEDLKTNTLIQEIFYKNLFYRLIPDSYHEFIIKSLIFNSIYFNNLKNKYYHHCWMCSECKKHFECKKYSTQIINIYKSIPAFEYKEKNYFCKKYSTYYFPPTNININLDTYDKIKSFFKLNKLYKSHKYKSRSEYILELHTIFLNHIILNNYISLFIYFDDDNIIDIELRSDSNQIGASAPTIINTLKYNKYNKYIIYDLNISQYGDIFFRKYLSHHGSITILELLKRKDFINVLERYLMSNI